MYEDKKLAAKASARPVDLVENEKPWRSFEVIPGSANSPLLIVCDHATNLLPPEYGTLGLEEAELNRHIGYDIGALDMSRELGRLLGATVIFSRFSRLLIDPNRGADDPTLVMQISDGAIIPGNAKLGEAEINTRLDRYHAPYHEAITAELDRIVACGLTPQFLAVHSYTDVWRGVLRKWHAGVLWDKDPRLAVPLIAELRKQTGLEVGDNEPYSGRLRGNGIYRHGTLRGFANALVEVRQDLIREPSGQREWASILANCLSAIFADELLAEALSRVDYFGSYTDIKGGDRHSL